MNATYPDAYYRDLQERLRDLMTLLQDRLPPDDRRLIDELIDANECGIALETMVGALSEECIHVDQLALDAMAALADTMGLGSDLVGRLRPLAVG